jgi:hypothetical protein
LRHLVAKIVGGPTPQMDILRGIDQTELKELFGTSFVKLGSEEGVEEEFSIELTNSKEEGMDWCLRCRRMNTEISSRRMDEGANLCRRCEQGELAMREAIAKMALMKEELEEDKENEENNTKEEAKQQKQPHICQMERP